jgi:hypothetical protein
LRVSSTRVHPSPLKPQLPVHIVSYEQRFLGYEGLFSHTGIQIAREPQDQRDTSIKESSNLRNSRIERAIGGIIPSGREGIWSLNKHGLQRFRISY